MKNFGEFLKKHLVLIICIVAAIAALGAGIWFLANPEKPETPDANTTQTTQDTENTGDLDLDTDMGFGSVDMDSGSAILPDGNTSSGVITPINPDNQGNTNQGDGNQGNTNQDQGNQGDGNQGNQESNTVEMSGSVVENPFK